jgi:DUF3024 family protein
MTLDILESLGVIEEMENFLIRVRPEEAIRPKLDIGYKIKNQSIIIHEIRPLSSDPLIIIEPKVAKTTYNRTKNNWKIFWPRADRKWHTYDPNPTVDSIQEFLRIVEKDQLGCFWG